MPEQRPINGADPVTRRECLERHAITSEAIERAVKAFDRSVGLTRWAVSLAMLVVVAVLLVGGWIGMQAQVKSSDNAATLAAVQAGRAEFKEAILLQLSQINDKLDRLDARTLAHNPAPAPPIPPAKK
jgi:hypothetical protein